MTLYLFLGIPAKCNLPVEKFHEFGVQSSKVKEGRSVFPMQQNISNRCIDIAQKQLIHSGSES